MRDGVRVFHSLMTAVSARYDLFVLAHSFISVIALFV